MELVHWVGPAARIGYPVAIRDGRAVYPTAQKPIHFDPALCPVVHPCIGVAIARKQGILRTAIPADFLHLSAMWEASLGTWPDLVSRCFTCDAVVDTGDDESAVKAVTVAADATTSHTAAYFCPMCMLASHTSCAQRLLGTSTAAAVARSAPPTSVPKQDVLLVQWTGTAEGNGAATQIVRLRSGLNELFSVPEHTQHLGAFPLPMSLLLRGFGRRLSGFASIRSVRAGTDCQMAGIVEFS